MLFNTLTFFLLFPLIFGLYWAIPARYNQMRKFFLILVSYLLYMNWKPAYVIVLFGVTLVTYWGGRILQFRDESLDIKVKRHKQLAWLFALLALMPLLVFKYYNFLNDSISDCLSTIGLQFALTSLNWAVPVGISFFTFQAVGYMLDVYYGRIDAERNFMDYMMFVSFFPQVASGPISKASELLPQIKKINIFDYNQAVCGLRYLLWGMFLKVVLADRAGVYVDMVFDNYNNFSGIGCIIACFMYSFQIYGDFAGYSFMAVGIAKMIGFDLINNFHRPYFSVSITDFWKRWHISLSRWLKDYVYIPLGGSRCGKFQNYYNIFVTFLVSGIWHGANWTFIIWGMIHGVCQIIEKMFGWNKTYTGVFKIGRIFLTFVVVTIAWTIFRSSSITEAMSIFSRFSSVQGENIANLSYLVYFLVAVLTCFILEIFQEFYPKNYTIIKSNKWVCRAVYVFLFCMILQIGLLDSSSFIYVSF